MWRDVAQEGFEAASALRTGKRWRSCGSRAYYAAYAMVTQVLIDKGLSPRPHLGTWSHEMLPQMASTHLFNGTSAAQNLASALRRLYRLRLLADYRPDVVFGRREAFASLGLMSQVFRQIGRIA